MGPTQILSDEHRVIEQVLDCLEAMVLAVRNGPGLDVERAARAVEVLRSFADRIHHGKEEERLFPRLEALGMPRHGGPIAVMLDDHRFGREQIQRMSDALGAAREGLRDGAQRFAEAAGAYVAMLRDHIAKEDCVLFPMADSLLGEAGGAELRAEFERFEREDLEPGLREDMLAAAEGLALHFGVPLAAQRSRPDGPGHGPC